MPDEKHYSPYPAQTTVLGVAGYVGRAADPATPPALLPPATNPLDVMDIHGAGVPVDGTSGTGVGQAGKGSRYTDTTAGNLYLNGGTKASPTWKLVTRAP